MSEVQSLVRVKRYMKPESHKPFLRQLDASVRVPAGGVTLSRLLLNEYLQDFGMAADLVV